MPDSKAGSVWHPRPCAPWQCQWCGKTYGTESVNAGHEPKCELRVEEK